MAVLTDSQWKVAMEQVSNSPGISHKDRERLAQVKDRTTLAAVLNTEILYDTDLERSVNVAGAIYILQSRTK